VGNDKVDIIQEILQAIYKNIGPPTMQKEILELPISGEKVWLKRSEYAIREGLSRSYLFRNIIRPWLKEIFKKPAESRISTPQKFLGGKLEACIVFMSPHISCHDAVSNDIAMMYELLKDIGYHCVVYAEACYNKNLERISEKTLIRLIQRNDTIVIYHHSIFWNLGEYFLKKVRGKLIIRYHNVTPSKFFEPYCYEYAYQCQKGRDQTLRFVQKYPKAVWLTASVYNAQEISRVSPEHLKVCPPFHCIESLNEQGYDSSLLEQIKSKGAVQILFVGRMAPNKGHMLLLKILEEYIHTYGNNVFLHIIGKNDPKLQIYYNQIRQLIQDKNLSMHVEFIGEADDKQLLTYYLASDFFVCASEHEGCCIPLLEAQYCRLPVIALDRAAVSETLGVNQLSFAEKNAALFASAIYIISQNPAWRQTLIEQGIENFKERFTSEHITHLFFECIHFVEKA
jgi:glycosyltransferase involved in cell wall biosynthesis